MKQFTQKFVIAICLLALSSFSYAEDDVSQQNGVEIQQDIKTPLAQDTINKELVQQLYSQASAMKVMRNCGTFKNVRNRTDLGQCVQTAMYGELAFAFSGGVDSDNGVLYAGFQDNYKSVESKKRINGVSREKMNELIKKYGQCLQMTARMHKFYTLEEVKTLSKENCKSKDYITVIELK